jgi:hypothetical protein
MIGGVRVIRLTSERFVIGLCRQMPFRPPVTKMTHQHPRLARKVVWGASLDKATLQLTVSVNTVRSGRTAQVRVYAVNYNVLRVMSGMGGLAYSN